MSECPGHLWSVAVDGSDPGWSECLFCKKRERRSVSPDEPPVDDARQRVLETLASSTNDDYLLYAWGVADGAELLEAEVRPILRALVREGLAALHPTFDDEGRLAGRGYVITTAGRAAIEEAWRS